MASKMIKCCDRIFTALNFKLIMIVATLLTTIPLFHAYIGGYVKIFLLYGIIVVLYTAVRQRSNLFSLFIKDKVNLLLILFLLSYALTVFANRNSNFAENFNQLVYMGVFFFLMFIFPSTLEKKQASHETRVISRVIIVTTFAFAVVSFITFLFLINGSYSIEGKTVYYGMYEHRLWGLYNPNTGSMLCIISILLSFGFFLRKEHKVFNIINISLQYICLLLTGSRSALYVLYVIVLAIAITIAYRLIKLSKIKKILTSCIMGILSVLIIIGAGNVVRFGLSYLPGTIKSIEHVFFKPSDSEKPYKFEIFDFTRMEQAENREGGILTGRDDLWKAGIKALGQSPVLGLGRENIANEAEKYLEGENWKESLHIGGLHNIYITVLVSSGILGFSILAVFAALSFWRVIKNPVRGRKIGLWYGVLTVITMTFYITELVEARILYQVGIFYVLFWTFLGLLNAFALRASESDEK